MNGKNPIDLSTYRSKGGLGGSGPPTWFPRAKFRIICVRLFKFYRVIYILSDKEPTEFSACRSKRGGRGGEGEFYSLSWFPRRKSLICALVFII